MQYFCQLTNFKDIILGTHIPNRSHLTFYSDVIIKNECACFQEKYKKVNKD